ncbi:MAG: hypothetical protein ABI193_27160 [Minicystis sp.]
MATTLGHSFLATGGAAGAAEGAALASAEALGTGSTGGAGEALTLGAGGVSGVVGSPHESKSPIVTYPMDRPTRRMLDIYAR